MLEEFPVCRVCEAEWDLEYPSEEVGPDEDGMVYTLFVTCTGPDEHDLTYELVVDDEGQIRTGESSGR